MGRSEPLLPSDGNSKLVFGFLAELIFSLVISNHNVTSPIKKARGNGSSFRRQYNSIERMTFDSCPTDMGHWM
jgi:hypothetical protein